jgi:hypothetical protein
MPLRIVLLLIACFAYATLRYVVFGDVTAAHLPAFVTNKALALAAAVALFPAALARHRGDGLGARGWEWLAGAGALLHVLLSLAQLAPAVYPPLFADGRLNLTGELVVLSGVLAAWLAWQMRGSTGGPGARLHVPLLLALLVHAVARGLSGWLAPGSWPGGLPPISLLAAVALAAALVVRFPRRA